MHNLDDNFVEKYAKKIMGFAYNKTRDTYLAEDLTQEIMLQLGKSLNKNIENMDAYVSTICKYTWSNFLRKNKRHWNYVELEKQGNLCNEMNVEQQVETDILTEQLKKEISYLCELHRKIILLFYFDNQTTKYIAEELSLNESTVRWHLSETRKELKMAMEIKDMHLDYVPVRMWCGHDGYCPDINMYGFANDLLVQNIIYACYGEPISLSEIARKLNVSAAYLEHHVEQMVEMDYLRVKKGKYQTTFYIDTLENQAKKAAFAFENIGPYAEKIFREVHKRIKDIMDIKFLGYDFLCSDDVEWMTYIRVAQELCYAYLGESLAKKNVLCPKRSDGSRHWVVAGVCGEMKLNNELEQYSKMCTCGYRYSDCGDFADMITCENYLNRTREPGFRNMDKTLINNISKIYCLMKENRKPDEFEKIIISELVREGYVKVENGIPHFTIMYLTKAENQRYVQIIEEIKKEVGCEYFGEYMEKCKAFKSQNIPSFIAKNEREYYASNTGAGFEALGWIIYHKMLNIPTGERALAVCTMVYEK